jgi:hypothetical protein
VSNLIRASLQQPYQELRRYTKNHHEGVRLRLVAYLLRATIAGGEGAGEDEAGASGPTRGLGRSREEPMAAGPEVVAPEMGEGGVGARCRRGGGGGRRQHDDSVREEQSGKIECCVGIARDL